jgi:hypothetical protein
MKIQKTLMSDLLPKFYNFSFLNVNGDPAHTESLRECLFLLRLTVRRGIDGVGFYSDYTADQLPSDTLFMIADTITAATESQ